LGTAGARGRLRIGELEQLLLGRRDVLQGRAGVGRGRDLGPRVLEDLLRLGIDGRRGRRGGKLFLRGGDSRSGLSLRRLVGPPLGEHLVHRVGKQHQSNRGDRHRGGQHDLAAPQADRISRREPRASRLLQRVPPQHRVHRPVLEPALPRRRQPFFQTELEISGSHQPHRAGPGRDPGHRDGRECEGGAKRGHADRLLERDEPRHDHDD